MNEAVHKSAKKARNESMSWSHAVRDIVVSAIDRGQLPIFGFFLVVLVLILKMPDKDVSALVFEIFASLLRGELIAYLLLIAVIAGWITHVRIIRKSFVVEADRIGREKSDLQCRLADVEFESSMQK